MVTLTGTFVAPDNTPVANGTLTLVLSQSASVSGVAKISTAPIIITLDGSGNIPANKSVYGVDVMNPSGLFYSYSVTSASGAQVVRVGSCSPTGSSFSFDS